MACMLWSCPSSIILAWISLWRCTWLRCSCQDVSVKVNITRVTVEAVAVVVYAYFSIVHGAKTSWNSGSYLIMKERRKQSSNRRMQGWSVRFCCRNDVHGQRCSLGIGVVALLVGVSTWSGSHNQWPHHCGWEAYGTCNSKQRGVASRGEDASWLKLPDLGSFTGLCAACLVWNNVTNSTSSFELALFFRRCWGGGGGCYLSLGTHPHRNCCSVEIISQHQLYCKVSPCPILHLQPQNLCFSFLFGVQADSTVQQGQKIKGDLRHKSITGPISTNGFFFNQQSFGQFMVWFENNKHFRVAEM